VLPFNPLDKTRDEPQQINEWKQWSAQRLFIDKLRATLKNRDRAASQVEAEQKLKADRAAVAVRKPGLQIR